MTCHLYLISPGLRIRQGGEPYENGRMALRHALLLAAHGVEQIDVVSEEDAATIIRVRAPKRVVSKYAAHTN
jgi:hypothetical protein